MSRINELRLISRIAEMYYVEERLQVDIARHLHISQATISRMLKRAEDEGIVRISIIPPTGTFEQLEKGLREKFSLHEAIVVDCDEDRNSPIMVRIGEAAAHLLETSLTPNDVVGISSWSQTIAKMVDNIHPQKNVRAKYVVQTLGGIGNPSVQSHATQMTTRLAKLVQAEPKLLPVQALAPSIEAKGLMISDKFVNETMKLFKDINILIAGIGAVEPSDLLARSGNIFSADELTELTSVGAVGDMSLRFFDNMGKAVQNPLDERVIGISLDELKQIERVIAVAGGIKKTHAIIGALRTGVIDTLITDHFSATRLLHASTIDENVGQINTNFNSSKVL